MSRLGIGQSCRHQRPHSVFQAATALPLILPSEQWNGVPGTGFASIPADPVRTTAKPAVRLLVPPHQRFTDKLTVGVMAMANDNGTLIGGIDRVRFHFEGRSLDVVAPRFHTITDANGVERRYWGYWINLARPPGKSGEANLYVEAIPADATMQRRVIGPYLFLPRTTFYDSEITVDPDAPTVAGANYATVGAAINFHRTNGDDSTLITVMKPMTEDLAATKTGSGVYSGKGYCTITAKAPVVFATPDFNGDVNSQFRTQINRLHFKGRNITFDTRYIGTIWSEPSADGDHWLDGCRFVNSGGRYTLWRAGPRTYGNPVAGSPYFTECEMVAQSDACISARLVRGCSLAQGFRDFASDGQCVVGNTIDGLDSTDGWLVDFPSLSVTYSGTQATATLGIAGPADGNSRTVTAKWGANNATFAIGRTETFYTIATASGYNPATAAQGYFVKDVADWLNSLPDWSASVLDNSRRASALALPDGKGAPFTDRNVKNVALQLVTCFDFHGDFYQRIALTENSIIAFNSGTGIRGQNIFLAANGGLCRDFVVVGNAFTNVPSSSGYAVWTQVSSQFAGTTHSHVVFAHNSMPTQRLMLRADSTGYDPDGYCLIANNALHNINWVGTPTGKHLDVGIANNVIDGNFLAPVGSTGTVIGGDYTTKFADSLAGNFTPAGTLAINPLPPVWSFGLPGLMASSLSPAGALPQL
ncbi:hypothetical protein [Porphyrobacter sp. YT40]|uniref:hypothetical protein n=1 Tax=Porphyrobacter sp. YT40 TaxID=2547601 RepID=UPI0011437F2D|nr:hypothetical protein [Porphyrobacter sp. YT40]QDH33871.1 hypothetical protein E2E27_05685 [Porphyrobacter sp. YT40]